MQQEHMPKPIPFIRKLCEHKTEEEVLEAEENFREYLLLIKELCDWEEQQESIPIDETLSV